VRSRSKDQDLIDELVAQMSIPDAPRDKTNGYARPAKTRTSSSGPSDEQVIEKCRAADNASKFSALFDHGDVHAHHSGDDSAAELALLGIMAFYTRDEAQLERLFSSSALGCREKWRRRADYRRRTISRALASLDRCTE
jgi:primase-polymerase (primpol)-like protein